MPENPLVVDTFTSDRRSMAYLDTDGDGEPDGFNKLLIWVLYDLPYPTNSNENDTSETLLGNREFEAIDKLGVIGERCEVIVHRIRGHSSAEGDSTDNQDLSLLRAEAVEERIRAIHANDNSSNVRVSALAIVEGLGESEPEVFAGEDDHPLNRRVEIEFEIKKIVPEPINPNDPPGTNWRIGYDQNFSFYMQLGAQIGFGTLERLNAAGDSFNPPDKKDFWYIAGGVGIELKGKLAGKAAAARDKIANGEQLKKLEKLALAADKQSKNLTNKINSMLLPERLTGEFKDLWKQATAYFELLGPDDWASKSVEQRSVAILEAMGLNSLISTNHLDGTFTTDEPRRMSEMDLSNQLLFQVSVQGQVGAGGSFALTGILMYIYDADANEEGEWIDTAISEAALDLGLVPGFGATVSANISALYFR